MTEQRTIELIVEYDRKVRKLFAQLIKKHPEKYSNELDSKCHLNDILA